MIRKKEPLAEQIGETVGYVSEMFDRKVERIKISVAEKSASTASGVILGVILGVLGLIMFIFALVTLAVWIAGMEDAVLGFGVVTLILLSLLLLIFLLRNVLIVNPTVRKVINIFFSDKDDKDNNND